MSAISLFMVRNNIRLPPLGPHAQTSLPELPQIAVTVSQLTCAQISSSCYETCPNQACIDDCFAHGSTEGQTQNHEQLLACLNQTCATELNSCR